MEGISQEAISLAGHLKLGKLIVLWDDNGISIDGPRQPVGLRRPGRALRGLGLDGARVDGHDPDAIAARDRQGARDSDRPTLIACRTTIGFGAPTKAGQGLGARRAARRRGNRRARARSSAGRMPPFEIPDRRSARPGARSARAAPSRRARPGRSALRASSARSDARCRSTAATRASAVAARDRRRARREFVADAAKRRHRVRPRRWRSSNWCRRCPRLIGGSADLTGSNNTQTKHHASIAPGNFAGNYIHYGVREHGMAAAMNGIALHGGFIPYGGTFLVFTDYCRPAIRLSALMRQRVIYVMTHDSIGLGEDGPTHQPVEHLAALRAIPNLIVFRPGRRRRDGGVLGDGACRDSTRRRSWRCRGRRCRTCARQPSAENLSAKGAYVLVEPEGRRDVTLLATGSEVGARRRRRKTFWRRRAIAAAVVSMPSMELFRAQTRGAIARRCSATRRASRSRPASRSRWHEWLGEKRPLRRHVGLRRLGAGAEALQAFRDHGGACRGVGATGHQIRIARQNVTPAAIATYGHRNESRQAEDDGRC